MGPDKVVRLDLDIGNHVRGIVFERQYDTNINDQQNCDSALKFLIKQADDKRVIAAYRVTAEGFLPLLLNLGLIKTMCITNARIFTRKPNE